MIHAGFILFLKIHMFSFSYAGLLALDAALINFSMKSPRTLSHPSESGVHCLECLIGIPSLDSWKKSIDCHV